MERLAALTRWVRDELGYRDAEPVPASADASFRRYFRFHDAERSFIVMDAPPTKEDVRPFIAVAQRLHALGLHVPQILAQDLGQGFLLLSDLGRESYLSRLSPDTVDWLYGDALDALLRLQSATFTACEALPPYDEALLRAEMGLFRDWFLQRHLDIALDERSLRALEDAFAVLVGSALEQPRVCVHRDYHSRNLMVVVGRNPGVLDFQDAVCGPLTYDLVSLLRDCYIAWPRERVEGWVRGYHRRLRDAGLAAGIDAAQMLRWFDLMGVQRHLKAIGIFARLNHRDGKPGYLQDIPRTLGYVLEVGARHAELAGLRTLVEAQVLPRLGADGRPHPGGVR